MKVLLVMGVIEELGFMGVTDIYVNEVMGVLEFSEVYPCLVAQGRSSEDLSSSSFQLILQAFLWPLLVWVVRQINRRFKHVGNEHRLVFGRSRWGISTTTDIIMIQGTSASNPPTFVIPWHISVHKRTEQDSFPKTPILTSPRSEEGATDRLALLRTVG